jgi:hypothetical protein
MRAERKRTADFSRGWSCEVRDLVLSPIVVFHRRHACPSPPPPERNGDGMMMMICATALASPLLALSARVSLTLRYLFLHSILSRHLTHTPTFGLASIFSVFFDLGL